MDFAWKLMKGRGSTPPSSGEVRSMGARLHSHYPEIGTTLAVWRPGKKAWRHGAAQSVPDFGDDFYGE